jgi:seryl-tRNA synthetase
MLDIKFIRENPELIRDAARKKKMQVDLDGLIAADDERKSLLQAVEERRAVQNQWNERIAREANPALRLEAIEGMRVVKEELQKAETELRDVMKRWQAIMVTIPNVPDISVPEGASDAENLEVKTWGEPREREYAPKSHIELMGSLGMLDLERGVKAAGFRGYILKGAGARLNFALWNFVMDHFEKKGGFTPMIVPSLVRREPFIGTGYLPQSEEDLYKTQDDDFLAGTAEVATMAYHMDEVLSEADFPVKYLSFSPCFRREAGSHGKDTKGIMRVHEFYKFEQVVLCAATHEESVRHHEELTKNAEELLQALEIPYRVVVNCGGDLGLGQVKKYDIESWVPSENTYRETHSSSYFHDFQTRRLNIRYRDAEGKLRFAHSLNNTALASPRILISLIENHQRPDGSIAIPQALVPFFGSDSISSS